MGLGGGAGDQAFGEGPRPLDLRISDSVFGQERLLGAGLPHHCTEPLGGYFDDGGGTSPVGLSGGLSERILTMCLLL